MGASGNLATCELVYLLEEMGIASGFDLGKLLEAASLAERLVGHPLPSKVYAAGPRISTGSEPST
jgi:hydroxymethylglutaryl-CoA lyase (EC 4.1.3.4)